MLILTRKVGESIQIGGVVKVTLTEMGQGQVKIGIEAPAEISILRSEIVGTENGVKK